MKLIKYLILSSILLVSGYIQGQFSISPQVGLNYGNFEVDYFGDLILEPRQKKTFVTLGLQINYLNNRINFSGDFNVSQKNLYNIRLMPGVFGPDIYSISTRIFESNMSLTYNLVNKLFVGSGIKMWRYNRLDNSIFKPYTTVYANLCTSYIYQSFRFQLTWSKYLSVFGETNGMPKYEILKAPELLSLKIGYDLGFKKKKSSI